LLVTAPRIIYRGAGGGPAAVWPTTRPSAAHDEVGAAVLRPGGLVARGIEGLLLAQAHRDEAAARHAQAHQVVAGRAGPLVPEGEVVVGRATLVAVALDRDLGVAVALQPEGVLLEDPPG